MEQQVYDVIIVGGSYAGLSAALSLGRSLRKVLVIDSGNPCNSRSPHSHNFLTNDGSKPGVISQRARAQISCYPSVQFISGIVTNAEKEDVLFSVTTSDEKRFRSRKILFATGITDTIPNIPGFNDCWGKSILHCPYCHGYEAKNKVTGVLGNGDMGFELAKVISNWTDKLTLYTNGTSTLSPDEVEKLNRHNILVVQNEIVEILEDNGQVKQLVFKDTIPEKTEVLFTQLPFVQQCAIPENMGCELTEKGFIHIDKCLETTIPGVYAAGDCLSLFRSVAHAVASGNKAGATINKQLIEEDF